MPHKRRRQGRMLGRLVLVVLSVMSFGGDIASAYFADDAESFNLGVSILRGALGAHARVLRLEVTRDGITVEAQDPNHRTHIDRWRYGTVVYLSVIPIKRLTGPQAINPTLINPDLEANLFDLDSVDLTAAARLLPKAVARARLDDPAAVTRMEIQRQIFILPSPSSGDVRWTLDVDSGRERAAIYANARGEIVGADLSGTHRAQNLNIIASPELVPEAAAAFRSLVGAGPTLTKSASSRRSSAFPPPAAIQLWDSSASVSPHSRSTPGTSTAYSSVSAR